MDPNNEEQLLHEILISYNSNSHTFSFPVSAKLSDLNETIASTFSIAPENQKLMAPKLGLLRDSNLPITSIPLPPKKILLMGSTTSTVANIQVANTAEGRTLRRFGGTGPIKPAKPSGNTDWQKRTENALYTFTELNVLRHLPNSERSHKYLSRLRDDPGIKAVMRKHKWTVPLLSEMDPAEHTTEESRTLGLNKNAGEEILLRLRTDAYDGYRDYNTVRKTLCHELAHNVHGPHDKDFWDLYKVIVQEVEKADWLHGGKTVHGQGDGGRMHWEGDEVERRKVEMEDGGGLVGGVYVLGGESGSGSSSMSANDRRNMAAKAAEERMKRMKETSSK